MPGTRLLLFFALKLFPFNREQKTPGKHLQCKTDQLSPVYTANVSSDKSIGSYWASTGYTALTQ